MVRQGRLERGRKRLVVECHGLAMEMRQRVVSDPNVVRLQIDAAFEQSHSASGRAGPVDQWLQDRQFARQGE